MAGQGGGGAAYIRLQNPDNDLTQSAQYWGGLYARQGEEARDRNDKAEIAKNKALKEAEEKYTLKGNEVVNTPTGLKGYDASMMYYAKDAINDLASLKRQGLEAVKRGDRAAADAIDIQIGLLNNNFSNVKKQQDYAAGIVQGLIKQIDEGKMSGQDEDTILSLIDNFESGNVDIKYDPNNRGGAKYITYVKDENGQDVPYEFDGAALIRGDIRGRDKVDLTGKEGFVKNTLVNLGFEKYDKVSGNFIKTNQQWGEGQRAAVDDQLNVLFASEDSASDVVFQTLGKRTPIGQMPSKEDIEASKAKLKAIIEGGEKKEASTKVNTSIAELEEKKRHNRKMEEKEEEQYSAKHYDILQAVGNNDFSQFGGSLKWEGKNYSTTGAATLHSDGKTIIIPVQSTDKEGKTSNTILRVPKTERAVSQLIDAFTGRIVPFDKTMQSKPFNYRESNPSEQVTVGSLLSSFFNENGKYTENDSEVVSALQREFPNAKISNDWEAFGTDNIIIINGKKVPLDKNSYNETIQNIEKALGVSGSGAVPVKASSGGTYMGIDDNGNPIFK